jgi:hypothetical protein
MAFTGRSQLTHLRYIVPSVLTLVGVLVPVASKPFPVFGSKAGVVGLEGGATA